MEHSRKHILVVDDEEGIRDLFKLILEQEGYECQVAPSGDAALQVLAAENVDLAFVDVMMPTMTGLSLFQHMKERHPEVDVVFITAVDHLKIGAYDYVVKPVTRKRLHQVVEETLEKLKAMLDEKHQRELLEEQTASQTTELDARAREVSALNRIVQSELTQKFTEDEEKDSNE